MELPIISLTVLIVGIGLLLWVVHTWISDPMVVKIFITGIVVVGVLWLIGILTGHAPTISFR